MSGIICLCGQSLRFGKQSPDPFEFTIVRQDLELEIGKKLVDFFNTHRTEEEIRLLAFSILTKTQTPGALMVYECNNCHRIVVLGPLAQPLLWYQLEQTAGHDMVSLTTTVDAVIQGDI